MSCRLILSLALSLALWVQAEREVEACGPEFPTSLLSNRPSSMLELPDGVFVIEASKLVPRPTVAYSVREGSQWRPQGGSAQERELYDQGAQAYHNGDHALAQTLFKKLLQLPAEQRLHRSTWAAYMLGRLGSGSQSVNAYAMVRDLVAQGFRDELGLAASSLGQEAREHLNSGDLPRAVALYAQQAAHGHSSGATSLLFLARQAAHRPTSLLLQDPLGQRLLGVYLYTRRDELTDTQAYALLETLANADTLAGSSALAAAAYREAQWELADRLAVHDPSASLSRWVLAKLALRRGDRARARALLEEVRKEQIASPQQCDPRALSRVPGELAIIALAQGRMMDAMKRAWAARHQHSGALYIAERVLTLAELTAFLQNPPPDEIELEANWYNAVSMTSLRDLLGRRLMRAGLRDLTANNPAQAELHFTQALSYLTESNRVAALVLAGSLQQAADSAAPINKARALYHASSLARSYGMETLGTSQSPDWAVTDGSLDLDAWRASEPPGTWIHEYEKQRTRASAPASNQRFHYRWLASELAEASADLLPPQSQAFAATLCHSARYIFNRDSHRLEALWKRYVREGPAVDFASDFGQACPEPDFLGARRYRPKAPRRPWLEFAAMFALLLAMGLVTHRVRRRSIPRKRMGELR